MLKRYDDAIRAAADIVAGIDRDVREKLGKVSGREERYTEKFVTLLEERLDGFEQGGLSWRVVTHVADKQSGQERDTGADLFVSLHLDFEKFSVQKGFQAQAKVNKNKRFGLTVDSKSRLKNQCATMLSNSNASFVFAYGEQSTKILSAAAAFDVLPNSITNLVTQSVHEFFYDFFVCRLGDRQLHAETSRTLQELAEQLRCRFVAAIMASETDSPVD